MADVVLGQDFAVRLRSKDLDGLVQKQLKVAEGQLALLCVEEKYDQTMGPGVHNLGSWLGSLLGRKGKESAILVKSGDTPLELSLLNLLTKDPIHVNFDTRLWFKFSPGRESLFLTNFMAGRDRLSPGDIKSIFYDEVRDASQTWAEKHTVKELAENLDLKRELQMEMESRLQEVLSRNGLALASVQATAVRCEAWDKHTQQRVETFLLVSEEEAKLEKRRRLFEVMSETELQALAEETEKVVIFERRAQIWEKQRRALASEEMNKVMSEEDLAKFMRQVDKQRLLRDKDFEEFQRTLKESLEDRDKARAQLVRLAELERDFEWKRKELAGRTDLSKQQIEGEMGLERLKLEQQMGLELRRAEMEVEKARVADNYQRSKAELDTASHREMDLSDARKEAEKQGMGREARRLDGELQLALREKQLAQERLHQAELIKMNQEQRASAVELELKRQEGELDLKIRELRERHQLELQRMGTLEGLSLHTLIAVSDPEKAPLLADLARTEAMKGLTPEQILAMAAEKSPQLGDAIKEIAIRSTSEPEKAFYERLLAEQKTSAEQMRTTYKEFSETTQKMFEKALETQADVSKAFARGGPAPSAPGAPGAPAAPRMVVCRRCFAESPAGTKYCPNCGEGLTAPKE